MYLKHSHVITMAAILIPIVTSMTGCTPSSSDELVIGIVGDQTGSANLDSTYMIMEQTVECLGQYDLDIVLHVGDMVESIRAINSFEDYRANFDRATEIMDRLPAPWYMTVGDHDVNPPEFIPLSKDSSRQTWFKQLCKERDMALGDRLYYSVDQNGYHIIVLNALEHFHTDPRWGSIFINKLSEDQIGWLRDDLEANKHAKGIVVLIHQPQWYSWSNWSEVHNLLCEYQVAAVVAGHFHYDQDDGTLDGIRYLTIGASGGVIKNADKNSGGAHQYAVLKVNGDKLSEATLYNSLNGDTMELTPRRSMDRIQALASMISSLWQDESFAVQNGKLMRHSTTGSLIPATKLDLESLANPIDLPITLTIRVNKNLCRSTDWLSTLEKDDGSHPLVLVPGERVGWANYTSVGNWYTLQPLWEGTFSDNVLNHPPTTISVTIEAQFEDTQTRTLASDVTFFAGK